MDGKDQGPSFGLANSKCVIGGGETSQETEKE